MNHKAMGIFPMLRSMIRRKWRKKGLPITLVCLLFFLLATAPILLGTIQEYLYRRTLQVSGSFDCRYEELSLEDTEKLRCDPAVTNSARMWRETIRKWKDDISAEILYAEPSLFGDISSFALLDGRLPETEDEILCERTFRKAYPDLAEQGSVQIGSRTYQIVGTFVPEPQQFSNMVHTPLFAAKFDAASYQPKTGQILLQLSEDTQPERFAAIQALSKRNQISVAASYNNTALEQALMQPNGNLEPLLYTIYKSIMLVLTVIGCIFIVLCFWLSLQNLRREIQISSAVGIPKRYLVLSMITVIVEMVLVGIAIAAVLSLGTIAICCRCVQFPFFVTIGKNRTEYASALLPFLPTTAMIIAMTDRFFPRDLAPALGNRGQIHASRRVYKSKSILARTKLPFLRIAKQNDQLHPMQKFLSVSVIAFSVCLPVSILFLFNTFDSSSAEGLYDYEVKYDYFDVMESMLGSDRVAQSYADLKKQPNTEVFPFFTSVEQATMQKSDVSKAYRNYQSAISKEYQVQFVQSASATYDESLLLVGTDSDTLQRMFGVRNFPDGIPTGQCIVVDELMSDNAGSISVGIKTGTQITLKPNWQYAETRSFTVAAVAKDLPFFERVYEGMIVVLMNEQDYLNYNPIPYPTSLYVNTTDPAQLEAFIAQQPEMHLVDLRERRKVERDATLLITSVGVGLLSALLAIVLVCCYFVLQDQTERMRGQYAMMQAVGIPSGKITWVHLYSIIALYCKSMVVGVLLSIASCFGVWLMIRKDSSYRAGFAIHWLQMLLPCAVIGVAFGIIAVASNKMIQRMDILDSLHQE